MRVIFGTQFRETATEVNLAAERLAVAERQVSSGKRIEHAADDPEGASRAVSDHATLSTIDTYVGSADAATSRLAAVDSTLSDIIDRIIAAQSATASARGTVPQDRRDAAAAELQGISEALLSDFNAQFRGAYLFAGTAATAPFTVTGSVVSSYQGDAGIMSVDVSDGRSVPVSLDGGSIARGSDASDIFATLSSLVTAVRAGDDVGMGQGLDALGRALNRTTLAQTRVGISMNALDATRAQLSDTKIDTTASLSKVENANMAEAISRMNENDTAYRAALAAFGRLGSTSLMDYLR